MNAMATEATNPAIAEIEARLRNATGAPNAHVAMRRLCSTVVKASEQTEPPYKIKPLLDVLDVAFEYETTNSGAAEASVSLRGEKLVLEVPRFHFRGRSGRYRRWRFSIAHEFAHIVLLRTLGAKIVELTYQDKFSYRFVEGLCDHAASHLLLPRTRLTEIIRRQGFTQDTVRYIAERFDTSEMAVLRATQDLLPGGAIFTIKSFRRNATEQTEPRVFFCSSLYSTDSVRPWLPRGCTMKHLKTAQGVSETDVTVLLNDKEWRLNGKTLPWTFGPRQEDMFYAPNEAKNDSVTRHGTAVICAAKGKYDTALFGREERLQ